jgi:hypothetical protein
VGRLDLQHAVCQAGNCVGMVSDLVLTSFYVSADRNSAPQKGAVILAKHAAQDHQDTVVGPAAVLDAASQARHAVAVSGCRISLDRFVIPPSWFLGKHCCEMGMICCSSEWMLYLIRSICYSTIMVFRQPLL